VIGKKGLFLFGYHDYYSCGYAVSCFSKKLKPATDPQDRWPA